MNDSPHYKRLAYLWAATILCSFPVLLLGVGNLLLAVVPQAQEFLRAFNDGIGDAGFYPLRQFLVLELVLFLWSLSVWYTCRLLLGYNYSGDLQFHILDDRTDPGIEFLRRWLPRLWGFLASGLIPLWYLRANGDRLLTVRLSMAAWFLLPATLAVAFMLGRRNLIRRRDAAHKQFLGTRDFMFRRLERPTKLVLGAALLLSFLFLYRFYANPTGVGEALGAAAILFMAMASWTLFGGVLLTLLPKTYGWPSLILLPFVFAAISSNWNDNHRLRSLAPHASGTAPRDERQTVAGQFKAWLKLREGQPGTPVPVFVVATAGGGIRAAYWTASVLSLIDEDTKGWLGCHTFAISGVSGGSLGAAAYVSALADSDGADDCGARGSYRRQAARNFERLEKFLGHDYLSPALGSMLFPDAVQRFIPAALLHHDRAWAMESSWEKNWTQTFGSHHFDQRFLGLYGQDQARLPYLFLNTTSVDQGKRVVQSALRLSEGQPVDGYDLMRPDIDTHDMPLSTAVDNSARFPYVAAAGSVYWRKDNPWALADRNPHNHVAYPFWGRVVDGGYFDNSGATTAREIVASINQGDKSACSAAQMQATPAACAAVPPAPATEYKIIAVQITNDSDAPPLCSKEGVMQGPARDPSGQAKAPALSESTAPLAGLLNTREGRSTFSQLQLIQAVDSDGECQSFWPISMPAAASDSDPALGWYLSKSTDQNWQPRILCAAADFEKRMCASFNGSPGLDCRAVEMAQQRCLGAHLSH